MGRHFDWICRLARPIASQSERSFVAKTYIINGAAHSTGFFAKLQARDPAFALRSVEGVRPMTLPDEPKLAPSAMAGVSS